MRQQVLQPDDRTRMVSRHSLAYILCAISELFRTYDFDPLDLLIIHAVLNGNVINVMRDEKLDRQFAAIDAVEPDAIKQGVSRAALSRFLNLPLETVRRRADRLRKLNVLADTPASAAMSSTSTLPSPRSTASRTAAQLNASCVCCFLRSRNPAMRPPYAQTCVARKFA